MTGTPPLRGHVNPFDELASGGATIVTSSLVIDPTAAPYNSVGDALTDDTVSLTAALNAAIAAHGVLALPAGKTFRITSAITIAGSDGWRIFGYGGGENLQPKILVDGNFTGLVIGTAGNIVEAFEINGVAFRGTNGGAAQRAIDVTYAKNGTIKGCDFRDFAAVPLYANGGGPASTFHLNIDDNWFVNNTLGGIYFVKGATAANWIRHNRFIGNVLGTTGYSLYMVGFYNPIVEENDFEEVVTAATNAAILISQLIGGRIVGNHSECLSFIQHTSFYGISQSLLVADNVNTTAGTQVAVFGTGIQRSAFERNTFAYLGGGTAGVGFQLATIAGPPNTFASNYYYQLATNKSMTGSYHWVDNDAPGPSGLALAAVSTPATIANTVAETAFARSSTFAAGFVRAGSTVRVRAAGQGASTGAPTVTLRVRIGGITRHTFTLAAVAAGPWKWGLEAEIVVQEGPGVSCGSRSGFGIAHHSATVVPSSTTGVVGGLNSTVDVVVDITAQWSAADPANILTMESCTIDLQQAGKTA